MNRDPTRWPDPTAFRPERHTNPNAEQQRGLLPFWLGLRSCIGQHLALAELHRAIPALARLGDVDPAVIPRFPLTFETK